MKEIMRSMHYVCAVIYKVNKQQSKFISWLACTNKCDYIARLSVWLIPWSKYLTQFHNVVNRVCYSLNADWMPIAMYYVVSKSNTNYKLKRLKVISLLASASVIIIAVKIQNKPWLKIKRSIYLYENSVHLFNFIDIANILIAMH